MIRVPGPGRFELRLPDGATNPYLLQAAIISAGLNGMDTKADPGSRSDVNMYEDQDAIKSAEKLPLNLLDAIRAFNDDKALKQSLGIEFSDAFIKLKMQEWESYVGHFSDWEKQNTLDV